jgi:AcrR family transcriptional regulator
VTLALKNPIPSCGRPRSEQARAAILTAAYSFIKKQPVAEVFVEQIALKAGVSRATIYRWWPAKEPLLVEAFLYKTGTISVNSASSPLDKLQRYVAKLGRFLGGEHGVIAARILAAIQDDEPMRDAFIKQIFPVSEIQQAIAEAAAKGMLPAEINSFDFADMLLGPLFFRLLIGHRTISKSFVKSIFEHAVAGSTVLSRRSIPNGSNPITEYGGSDLVNAPTPNAKPFAATKNAPKRYK